MPWPSAVASPAASSASARGRYLGGDDGRALCASAEAWLLPRGLPDPARLAALLASGLCDTHAR